MQIYGKYLIMIPMKEGYGEPIPALVEYDKMNFLGEIYWATYHPTFEGTFPEVESYKDADITEEWLSKYTNLSFHDVLEMAGKELDAMEIDNA